MAMYVVGDLYSRHSAYLELELIVGSEWLWRAVAAPEAQRPGVSLSGYLKNFEVRRLLIFGQREVAYLSDLTSRTRKKRLQEIINTKTPAVFLANCDVLKEVHEVCREKEIPLFKSRFTANTLLSKMSYLLAEDFSPTLSCHGTLVEAFGVGVLIQGDSAVGKSEAALGLIERGHRLVADDIVQIRVREGSYLEGTGPELTRHLMEIRGIGIINVAHLYGAVCVRDEKRLDLVVKLEEWNDRHFYDRVGLERKECDLLGVKLPFHILPVKPGRDVVLLLETIVLNHRLREMGYNSAKEFNTKLHETISRKQVEASREKEKISGQTAMQG